MGKTCDPGRDRFWEAREMLDCVESRSFAYDDRCRIGGCGLTVPSVIIGGKTARLCEGSCCDKSGEVVEVMVVVMDVFLTRCEGEKKKRKKKSDGRVSGSFRVG